MKITRRSLLSGKTRTMDIPVSPEQMAAYELEDLPIQVAFPELSPAEREFIKSGITQDEWGTLGEDEKPE